MNRALATGATSNCGVPETNASFSVSPSATAETIAGVEVEADGAAGHSAEAAPEAVQVRATGLVVG